MTIHKILNNNVAVVIKDEKEMIITGRGICFKKKVGDIIEENLIEKEFLLLDDDVRNRFMKITTETTPQCLKISDYIIKKAKKVLKKELNENIYVSLTDHIQFTINRYYQGMQLKNDMLWHIKKMYPEEFELGQKASELIQKEFNISLLPDESSFIALHIVSAELNEDIPNVYNITKIVQDILSIVTYHFNITLNEDSIHYFRFVTHLKFFAQRISNKILYEDEEDDGLFEAVISKYSDAYECATKIGAYIKNTQKRNVTNEELMYLTIHIKRMIMEDEKKGGIY